MQVLKGRCKIKGLCETLRPSRAGLLHTFKAAYEFIVRTLEAPASKDHEKCSLAIEGSGFLLCKVAAEYVL